MSCGLMSAGLVSAALVSGALTSVALSSPALMSPILAESETEAVVPALSSLKSPAVGGGTLAGSGIGTAASIARSAALLCTPSLCASAWPAEIVRKVAATAISTRSYPRRPFTPFRICHTPRVKLPRFGEQFRSWFFQVQLKHRPRGLAHPYANESSA